MTPMFRIRANTTVPWLEFNLTRDGGVSPLDYQMGCSSQGASENFVSLPEGTTVTAFMERCGRTRQRVVLLGETEIVDASMGQLRYKFALPDTATPGTYYFGVTVTFPDGGVMTWPYVAELFPIEILR